MAAIIWIKNKLGKAWPWLKWVLVVLLLYAGIWAAKCKLSSLTRKVAQPLKWQRIPGSQTHVLAQNPNTGTAEAVELPMGVKARHVQHVGITKSGRGYEITTLHDVTDRARRPVSGSDLSL